MRSSIKGFLAAITVLCFVSINSAGADTPPSLCGPVASGAINFMAWECWNDSIFQVVNSDSFDANGWQYTLDGGLTDFAGPSGFDICGMGFRETSEEFWFTINAGFSLESPYVETLPDSTVINVTYGDLFINLSGLDFAAAHSQGKLFAVHFAAGNDSGITQTGVYGNVVAKSVVAQNDGPNPANRQGYEDYISNFVHGVPGYGDLPLNQSYYGLNMGLNVLEGGTFLGELSFIDNTQLASSGYDAASFSCPVTIAFKFPKQLIIDQCGVIGGDGSSCRDCNGVACGGTSYDICGICGGDGTSCLDCNDTPNGGAQVDACGICGGDGTSCLDCAGTPNGTANVDRCGVCNGDGFSCCECTETDISDILADMRSKLTKLFKANNKEFKRRSRGNVMDAIRKLKKQNKALYEQAMALIESIPEMARVCLSTEFCTEVVTNKNTKNAYNKLVKKLGKLTRKIPKPTGGVCNRSTGCGKIDSSANIRRIQNENKASSSGVPDRTSVCS